MRYTTAKVTVIEPLEPSAEDHMHHLERVAWVAAALRELRAQHVLIGGFDNLFAALLTMKEHQLGLGDYRPRGYGERFNRADARMEYWWDVHLGLRAIWDATNGEPDAFLILAEQAASEQRVLVEGTAA